MMTAWSGMDLDAWLWMFVWILALLGMVWLLVRGSHTGTSEQDALEIIRTRFARGEIDKDEYERARDLLTDPRPQRSQTGVQK